MEFVEEPNFTKVIQRFPDSDYAAFQQHLALTRSTVTLSAGPADFEKRAWLFQAQELAKAVERESFTSTYRNRKQSTSW